MTDPFQNVDAAGKDFISSFAETMELRQSDPTMEAIVASYLAKLDFAPGGLTVEVGAGAGAVTRRIADVASPGQVIGYEPSQGFVAEAVARAKDYTNLTFEVADGAELPLLDGAADAVVLHTVLSHVVAPDELVAEAARVLKPGGRLVLCDNDFSKATLRSSENDPLDVCAKAFVAGFVTDPHIVGKLRGMVAQAGLMVMDFTLHSRLLSSFEQQLPWVELTTDQMVERGEIGRPLAEAMVAELARRAEAGTLYGYQVFASLIAEKPE